MSESTSLPGKPASVSGSPNAANGTTFAPLSASFFRRNAGIQLGFLISPSAHVESITRFHQFCLLNVSYLVLLSMHSFALLSWFKHYLSLAPLLCLSSWTPHILLLSLPTVLHSVERVAFKHVQLIVPFPCPINGFALILGKNSKSLTRFVRPCARQPLPVSSEPSLVTLCIFPLHSAPGCTVFLPLQGFCTCWCQLWF